MPVHAPLHPERPVRRAAVALLLSLGVHAVAVALLVAWAVSVLAAQRKAEEARPREVALADVDAGRWEENRRLTERVVSPPAPRPPREERTPTEERSAFATFAPGGEGHPQAPPKKEAAARPPTPGANVEKGLASDKAAGSMSPAGPRADAARASADAGAGALSPLPAEGTIDLHPRPPQAGRPLAMRFDPVGKGQTPFTDGTAFAGLTVQTPEAWRFTNFFGRAVEAMNSVYRYELGAPMPPSLHAKFLANPRAGGGCSMTAVSIDASGKVQEASVRRSSGMPDVDALIVEVIRRTAPFVNVPPELVGERGVYSDTWGLCIMWGGGRG